MNEVIETTQSHRRMGVRGLFFKFGRGVAFLTVAAVALSTTAAGLLVWWYATKSPTAVPSLAGVDHRLFLVAYGLLMVSPWWALLAVLFRKLNWLERPKAARQPVMRSPHRTTPAAG